MKHFRRILFNTLTAISLLLAIATAGLHTSSLNPAGATDPFELATSRQGRDAVSGPLVRRCVHGCATRPINVPENEPGGMN